MWPVKFHLRDKNVAAAIMQITPAPGTMKLSPTDITKALSHFAAHEPPRLQPPSCEMCDASRDLQLCKSCSCVYYCGEAHRSQDRSRHEALCNQVETLRKRLGDLEVTLQGLAGPARVRGIMDALATPEEAMGADQARMLDWLRYLDTCIELAGRLLTSHGGFGARRRIIEISRHYLRHVLEVRRHNSRDIEDRLPAIDIRLGQDQDAYDLCKWYATMGRVPNVARLASDPSAPFLHIKNADVLEPPDLWTNMGMTLTGLSHACAVALIKVRVLQDVLDIRNAIWLFRTTRGFGMPLEVVNMIIDSCKGPILRGRRDIILRTTGQATDLIRHLEKQVSSMHDSIARRKPDFWRGLLDDPGVALQASAPQYQYGQSGDWLVTYNSIFAWYESAGAVKTMRRVISRDIR